MALEIMKDDVKIIQGLSDYPNQEEGLTSGEMKAKFDEAAVKLQGYINNSVVPAVNDKLSASELSGAVADTVEQTLGSITPDKIGAAPAGFGLGETVKWIYAPETLADYIHSGFYSWSSGVSDAPFSAGSMIVIKRSAGYAFQVAFRDDIKKTEMAVRKLTASTWGEWEWINPPMETGVEYRTTEKYNGKPVYMKLVDFGALPNNASKDVLFTSSSGANSEIIDIRVRISPPKDSVSGSKAEFDAYLGVAESSAPSFAAYTVAWSGPSGTHAVRILTKKDMSNYTATVMAKYTKE